MNARIWAVSLIFLPAMSFSDSLRIASYNSNYLSACVNYARKEAFQSTVNLLNADVIAFQEVRDRSALELFFPAEQWHIIIDNESTDDQNLAYVIRKGVDYSLISGSIHNAEKEDFLFTSSSNFPDKRDVLTLIVRERYLGTDRELLILNHHAKSRYGGRESTEPTRIAASLEIVKWIKSQDLKDIVVLGDFNDTPDDASVNTLEMGINSVLEMENSIGSLLINLSEPLVLEDYVSYGLNSRSLTADKVSVNPVDIGSRFRNFTEFSDDINVGKAMYDQILVSPTLLPALTNVSHDIFSNPVAVLGNSSTRASDHIPIYVDLFTPPVKIKVC